MGAFGANHHLRQTLVFFDMPTLQQPEAYIGGIDKAFDDSGEFVNPSTRAFCAKFLEAFDGMDRAAASSGGRSGRIAGPHPRRPGDQS